MAKKNDNQFLDEAISNKQHCEKHRVIDGKTDIEWIKELKKNILGTIYFRFRRTLNVVCNSEDLYQEGVAAILEAMDKYDPSKGTAFKTYAINQINYAMLEFIRENANMLAGGNYAFHWIHNVAKNWDISTDELEKISREAGHPITHNTAIAMLRNYKNGKFVFNYEDVGGIDHIAEENVTASVESHETKKMTTLIPDIKKYINGKDLTILEGRYGFYGKPYKKGEIAKALNVSERTVSYSLKKSIMTLRHIPNIESYL